MDHDDAMRSLRLMSKGYLRRAWDCQGAGATWFLRGGHRNLKAHRSGTGRHRRRCRRRL